jgi:hypothetical protein
MARSTQHRFAAAALAIAAVSLTAPGAQAFTQENLNANGSGNSRFADPDDQVKNFGQGSQPFGPNGPTLQFGAGAGAGPQPFNRYQGFAPPPPPPQPYARPPGNGD